MDLASKIESVLFWKAEPVSIKKLASYLKEDETNIKTALELLRQKLEGRGIALVTTGEDAMLGTSKENSGLIEDLSKEELTKDLGKAALETLTIILYEGPIARADIDFIRGVNSQFIVRNLLVRGLIERIDNPRDARSFLYKPTIELLSHLGISRIEELPEFEQIRKDIQSFKAGDANNNPNASA